MPRRRWALALLLSSCVISLSEFSIESDVPSDPHGFANALYQATGVSFVEGNEVELVNNGAFFEALERELAGAKHSIDIVTFIWRPGDPSDRLLAVIRERVLSGVECRVLVDRMGSRGFTERVQPDLEAMGCEVELARPSMLTKERNHRKLFLVDGRVGFTGGLGVYKDWKGNGKSPGEWRDTNVRVRGPVVAQLEQAFAENWLEASGRLLPASHFVPVQAGRGATAAFVASTSTPNITKAERLTQLAIASAKKRVWIGNAYFVPSQGLMELIEAKRREGVDVRLMGPSDTTDHPEWLAAQRRFYGRLRAAGVRIYEYQPTMFHSKTMLVDDALSVVGSINLDRFSQEWMDEGALVVLDEGFAKALEADWERDVQRCREVK